MTEVTESAVLDALRTVQDPDLHRDIVSLDFIQDLKICGGAVGFTLQLTTPACPVKEQLKQQAHDAVAALPGVEVVNVRLTAQVKSSLGPASAAAGSIKNVVAVTSGKGGVGKTTCAVNLAAALAATGAKVGLLDADVYGPNIPVMMGISGNPRATGEGKILPLEAHGVKTISVGYMVEDGQPVMWRGPMLHRALEQFFQDVEWGEIDYLLVDMPPGTGDAQISLAQLVPLTGAVLVTTPQAVATFDVTKAISMFKQVNTEILGIVENMSGQSIEGMVEGAAEGQKVRLAVGGKEETLTIDSEGRFRTVVDVFGRGGAERLAAQHGFPQLGSLPLDPTVRVGGDGGDPVTVTQPDSLLSQRFAEVAGKVAQRIAVRSFASLPILD